MFPSSLPPKLLPGTPKLVGQYHVVVEKYLSEGAFAHVYQVRTKELVYGTDTHILKRVVVPEKHMLDDVRREVEVMKLVRNHPHIVNMLDADAFHMPDGNHEVLILMEKCDAGGLIGLMNTRLQTRFTTAEILQIFIDVCEGVAKMHGLSPPLAHMDIKVENVLQSGNHFKLCDFGSARTARVAPGNLKELQELEMDIGNTTTLQYRAPELIDLSQGLPIDEKADIWALGVFLYKLCYYLTPFENKGPEAVLNVDYEIPPLPVYPPSINLLIGSMLQAKATNRPTIFEILQAAHVLRGTHSTVQPTPLSASDSDSGLLTIITSVSSRSVSPTPLSPSPSLNLLGGGYHPSKSHTLPNMTLSPNMPPLLQPQRAFSPLPIPPSSSRPHSSLSMAPGSPITFSLSSPSSVGGFSPVHIHPGYSASSPPTTAYSQPFSPSPSNNGWAPAHLLSTSAPASVDPRAQTYSSRAGSPLAYTPSPSGVSTSNVDVASSCGEGGHAREVQRDVKLLLQEYKGM